MGAPFARAFCFAHKSTPPSNVMTNTRDAERCHGQSQARCGPVFCTSCTQRSEAQPSCWRSHWPTITNPPTNRVEEVVAFPPHLAPKSPFRHKELEPLKVCTRTSGGPRLPQSQRNQLRALRAAPFPLPREDQQPFRVPPLESLVLRPLTRAASTRHATIRRAPMHQALQPHIIQGIRGALICVVAVSPDRTCRKCSGTVRHCGQCSETVGQSEPHKGR